MAQPLMFGTKVRALRRREKLTQAQLADRLGISASYLNLIENNRRPLTANMLLKLAEHFHLDLSSFAPTDEARLVSDLREVFADPMFESGNVSSSDLREMAVASPAAASAVLKLYQSYCSARQSVDSLAEKLYQQGAPELSSAADPTEEVNDLLQRHGNYFPELERAAEELWDQAGLHFDDVWGGLINYLRRHHKIDVRVLRAEEDGKSMRRYDPKRGEITLSEVLPPRSRRFQLAHQVGLICCSETIDSLDVYEELSSDEARALARVVLSNYFAAAVLMPYQPFLDSALRGRYDIELLAHRYRTSFEQVCHRLTTLRRPGAEGIPLHFLRIDIAGNISKRFSGSGIGMPRFSGACPRWNVHAAFLTPGMFRIQLSRMPDGQVYFCIARTVRRDSGGYNMPHTVHSIAIGCDLNHAREMVYSDGVDLDNPNAATPVGVTCRTCEQLDCEQRVSPPMQHPLKIDENVRGVSFFAPVFNRNPPLDGDAD
ncbi:MAG: short-chain fatty acyl-CoA regulator family protein [Proteobacteria bacterium]|nr:short-chain fatty acyl-CoA regulator family protein [Pseudomonadota bacterium]